MACLAAAVLLSLAAPAPGGPGLAPVPDAPFLQLTRRFFSTADGLPADGIDALAVTLPGGRPGVVLAAAGGKIARLEGERWRVADGPEGIAALFAPRAGRVEALAGGADGIWALSDGRWTREAHSPHGVVAFADDPGAVPWALSPAGVWRRGDRRGVPSSTCAPYNEGHGGVRAGVWERVQPLDPDMGRARGLCLLAADELYVAAERGLFALTGKRPYWRALEVGPGRLPDRNTRAALRIPGAGEVSRRLESLPHGLPVHMLVATRRGLTATDGRRGWHGWTGSEGLPIEDLTLLVSGSNGNVWLGSDQGLVRWRQGEWTFLGANRWLPDNRVTALAADGQGIWVGTPGGLAHLFPGRLTLREKADLYQSDLEARDRRHGYVTVMQLRAPGSFAGATQEISDNDGLWTAMYVGSQTLRYAVTGSPRAREQARRSMEALLRLERITGIPGFPARAISSEAEPGHGGRSAGEWHPSSVEKGWTWKADTSSDEIVGHYFAFYLYFELVANGAEKKKIRATCKRITDHILDHGYYLVDLDGRPTTWGVWAPEKLNEDPKWWPERGLNSLEILSHMKVASSIVGEPRYEAAYRDLVARHGYAINTLRTKVVEPGEVNHSDDELAFLSYYPLLQLEKDAGLRTLYLASLRRSWEVERVEASPLWNFIYGACAGGACDAEAAVEALREIPLDLVDWKTRNSHRADLRYDAGADRFGRKQLLRPLPWAERPLHKWNGNPFVVDGGSDLAEEDQTMWLLPYWLGRYHGMVGKG